MVIGALLAVVMLAVLLGFSIVNQWVRPDKSLFMLIIDGMAVSFFVVLVALCGSIAEDWVRWIMRW